MNSRASTAASKLQHLLQLVGAAEAPALLRQLVTDLTATHSGLTEAAQTNDLSGLRRHSHVLISLAGTIGADPLCANAAALNLSAQGEGKADRAALTDSVLRGTEALIQSLCAEARAGGIAP